MSSDAVTVQRLRVRALRPALAQGMGDRMAEALRVASKPPALANRFVLIRRLRLSVPPAASAQTIALLIEREWLRVLGSAVFIDEAGASAEVVWAPDEGHARVALMERWLVGEGEAAWFWQRLAPASASAMLPVAERIAASLTEPLAETLVAAVGMAPNWWQQALPMLAHHGQLGAVLAALPTQPRARLEQLAEARGVRDALPWPALPDGEASPDPERAAGRVVERTVGDERALMTEPYDSPADEAERGKVSTLAKSDEAHDVARIDAAIPGSSTFEPAASAARVPALRSGESPAASSPSTPMAASGRPSAPLRGQATEWAGLWLLVPVLLRQGFAAEPLAPHDPRSRHQAAVFTALLQRLRQRYRFDPVARDWLDAQTSFCTEAAPSEALDWWLRARRACVRDARLPLLRLLRRPGELLIAPHRLDVVMPLRSLDIRLRRAGFDIDPGYLPWLDVVLRFHYV